MAQVNLLMGVNSAWQHQGKVTAQLHVRYGRGPSEAINVRKPGNRGLNDALDSNPLLRFPNLDKVLPLPPAALPP